jgi:hypothetical protein
MTSNRRNPARVTCHTTADGACQAASTPRLTPVKHYRIIRSSALLPRFYPDSHICPEQRHKPTRVFERMAATERMARKHWPYLTFSEDRMGEEILVFNTGRYRSRTFIHNLVNRSGAISYIFANFSFDSAHIACN